MKERITGTRLDFIQRKLTQARRMLKFCKVEKNRAYYAGEVKRLEGMEKHLQRLDATHTKCSRSYEIRSQ